MVWVVLGPLHAPMPLGSLSYRARDPGQHHGRRYCRPSRPCGANSGSTATAKRGLWPTGSQCLSGDNLIQLNRL
jgi:hypothetical protein